MIFYSIFFIFIIFSFCSIDRRFQESYFPPVLVLIFSLIVGFRYASTDYFQYEYIFNSVNDLTKLGVFIYPISDLTPIESGFALFAFTVKSLGGHFPTFIFIFALLSVAIKFYAFHKLSPFFLISILIYVSDEYFFKDMGQIRNAMASGILLFSYYSIYKGWFWRHALFVFIAGMFHGFAFVALPLYFLRYFKSQKVMVAIVLLSLCIALLGGIGMLMSDIFVNVGFDENSRIIKYSKSDYVEGKSIYGGTVIFHMIWCFFYIKYYSLLKQKWAYNEIFVPLYVYGTCLMLVLIDFGILSGRIREMICLPVQAVLLPSFLFLFKGQEKIFGYLAISGYCFLYFMAVMSDYSYDYQFYFFR